MPSRRQPAPSTDRLATLTPSLRALAERGVPKSFRKGHRLIEEGDSGDTLYIITKGQLRVFGSNADNSREITYGTYSAGEYIGEMSLDGGPRSASVEALEAVECVQVTRQTLLQHIAEHPEFALELLAKVNFIGPVRMIHRFLPRMIERRSGKIVTVASDAGRVGSTGETFYAGTKGAIIAFTKSLARETARAGLTCNCVAPVRKKSRRRRTTSAARFDSVSTLSSVSTSRGRSTSGARASRTPSPAGSGSGSPLA